MDNENSLTAAKDIFNGKMTSLRPWVPVVAQIPDHSMILAKISPKTFYSNARIFVDTIAEVTDYYGLDDLIAFGDTYNFEVEALGGKMIYGENGMPTIDQREPLIKQPEDLLKLHTPDYYRDGRIRFTLDCIKFSTEYGVKTGVFCAPFSLAVGLRSYQVLIKDMRKHPQFTHDLFNFIIDKVLIPFLKVQKEYCGVTVSVGADAWSGIPNLSVKELKEWVLPYDEKLKKKAKEIDMTVFCLSGGYIEQRPENFNVNLLNESFDMQIAAKGDPPSLVVDTGHWEEFPFQHVRSYTAKYLEHGIKPAVRVQLGAQLLRSGPEEKIVKSIKHAINALGRDHELAIYPSVLADTPPQHLHAAVTATHMLGHKPIADDLDKIEYIMPKRESFEEWKSKKGKQSL